jgi:spore germination protein
MWRRWPAVIATVLVGLAGLVVVILSSRPAFAPNDSQSATWSPRTRIGYVPYWDQERAFDVVRQNLELFDDVSPVWYSLEVTGQIVLADPEHTTVDHRTVRFLQKNGIRVIPTVTNLRNGDWDAEVVRAMLHDPTAMRAHIRELTELAVTKNYDGIDIDYEHLRAVDRSFYSNFLHDLGAALDAEDKLLTTAVHPKTSDAGYDERNRAQDFRSIGAAVDQVRVMTYDYSWETSPPGPVAPAEWVEEVIAWTVTQIPRNKVILGIVLLGYDWADQRGTTVEYEQAQSRARANEVAIRRTGDGSPSFTYRDSSGRRHEVWYEDAVSVRVKLDLVSKYNLGGAFFWRLGGEDPETWRAVRAAMR